MQFIKSRLTRDNFWNIVFWFGMVISAILSDISDLYLSIPKLPGVLLILTWSLVPYLLTRATKVTYTKDKVFINSQGENLHNRYPTFFGLVFVINIPISVSLFFWTNNFVLLKDSLTVYTAIGLFCPVIYFIYRNCPISILFNKNSWKEEIIGISSNDTHHPTSSSSSNRSYSMSSNPITDLSYSGSSSNIHNTRYYNR